MADYRGGRQANVGGPTQGMVEDGTMTCAPASESNIHLNSSSFIFYLAPNWKKL